MAGAEQVGGSRYGLEVARSGIPDLRGPYAVDGEHPAVREEHAVNGDDGPGHRIAPLPLLDGHGLERDRPRLDAAQIGRGEGESVAARRPAQREVGEAGDAVAPGLGGDRARERRPFDGRGHRDTVQWCPALVFGADRRLLSQDLAALRVARRLGFHHQATGRRGRGAEGDGGRLDRHVARGREGDGVGALLAAQGEIGEAGDAFAVALDRGGSRQRGAGDRRGHLDAGPGGLFGAVVHLDHRLALEGLARHRGGRGRRGEDQIRKRAGFGRAGEDHGGQVAGRRGRGQDARLGPEDALDRRRPVGAGRDLGPVDAPAPADRPGDGHALERASIRVLHPDDERRRERPLHHAHLSVPPGLGQTRGARGRVTDVAAAGERAGDDRAGEKPLGDSTSGHHGDCPEP